MKIMNDSDDYFVDPVPYHSPETDGPIDSSPEVEQHTVKKRRRGHYASSDVKSSDVTWGLADRPNAYTGNKQEYRKWTSDERAVLSALQQQRAEDLSVHLYNAYMVESSKRGLNEATKAPSDQLKDKPGKQGIELPDYWTAWPMPPDQFIRQDLMSSIGGHTTTDYTKSGMLLRDTIIAAISRAARHRWESREWETPVNPQTLKRKRSEPTESETQKSPAASLSEMGQSMSRNTSIAPTEADDDDIDDPFQSGGMPLFSSQAQVDDASSSSDHEEVQEAGGRSKGKWKSKARELEEWANVDTTPVPNADNERIDRLLAKPAQHLIGKVEKLLDALHTARQSYARKKKRMRKASESEVDLGSSRASTELGDDSPGRIQSPVSFDNKLKTRDWSDVLGMAALTGFSEAAVQRASERCAALFNEDMLFRTFHEGTANSPSHFTEILATGNDPNAASLTSEPVASEHSASAAGSESDEYDLYELIRSKTSGHCCPYPTCSRHGKSFASAEALGRHLRRRHSD